MKSYKWLKNERKGAPDPIHDWRRDRLGLSPGSDLERQAIEHMKPLRAMVCKCGFMSTCTDDKVGNKNRLVVQWRS